MEQTGRTLVEGGRKERERERRGGRLLSGTSCAQTFQPVSQATNQLRASLKARTGTSRLLYKLWRSHMLKEPISSSATKWRSGLVAMKIIECHHEVG